MRVPLFQRRTHHPVVLGLGERQADHVNLRARALALQLEV